MPSRNTIGQEVSDDEQADERFEGGFAVESEYTVVEETHELRPSVEQEIQGKVDTNHPDANVIGLTLAAEERLLANDRGLIEVARTHGVECWWVTTLLLTCAKGGTMTGEGAAGVLYDLVDEGMNLHPKVYTQVQNTLQEIGD